MQDTNRIHFWRTVLLAVSSVGLAAPVVAQTPLLELEKADGTKVMQVNDDGGLVVLGVFNVGALPVTGAGTRLMWWPARAAFRAGRVNGSQWDAGTIGSYSTAMGYNTTASEGYATAMGFGTTASGPYSTALGGSTTASQPASMAMGIGTTASGEASTAMGRSTTAQAYASLTLGRYNAVEGNQFNWLATDPVLVVGNGTSSADRSNALTLLKNGDFTIAGRLETGDGSIASGASSAAMGESTTASGYAAVAVGYHTTASADYATAMGAETTADGISSTAMGSNTEAVSDASTAMGQSTTASGDASTAMGNTTTASGRISTAMGFLTTAQSNTSVAMGRYNVDQGSLDSWVATDPVLTVGNGTSDANRSNALTLLKNGDLTIAGRLATGNGTASGPYSTAMGENTTASGWAATAMGRETSASGEFSTAMGSYANTNGKYGAFVYGDDSSTLSVQASADNQFMVRAAGGTYFYSNSGMTAGVQLSPGAGSWSSVSDVNRKENFRSEDGEAVLAKIAGTKVTSWNYKSQDLSVRHVGPTAQDFYAAFGLGESDTTITTLDISGVNMLAIQALERRTQALMGATREIEALRAEVAELRAAVREITSRLTGSSPVRDQKQDR